MNEPFNKGTQPETASEYIDLPIDLNQQLHKFRLIAAGEVRGTGWPEA
jgi:hypothetical protein